MSGSGQGDTDFMWGIQFDSVDQSRYKLESAGGVPDTYTVNYDSSCGVHETQQVGPAFAASNVGGDEWLDAGTPLARSLSGSAVYVAGGRTITVSWNLSLDANPTPTPTPTPSPTPTPTPTPDKCAELSAQAAVYQAELTIANAQVQEFQAAIDQYLANIGDGVRPNPAELRQLRWLLLLAQLDVRKYEALLKDADAQLAKCLADGQ